MNSTHTEETPVAAAASLHALFELHNAEYGKFELIRSPRHPRPDICAFLMLDELMPAVADKDMVSAAESGEIFLSVNCEELAKVVTSVQVRNLVRCGVRYSPSYDCLCMFV